MSQVIMVGCDLHDKTMVLKIAQKGRGRAETESVKNTAKDREAMIGRLKQRAKAAGGARIVFVYEASGLGLACTMS